MTEFIITVAGQPITISGKLPALNTVAPNFTIVKEDGVELSLYDIKDKHKIILIFPSVDAQECSRYVRECHQQLASFTDNIVLFAISRNDIDSLNKFCGAHEINNLILGSDKKYRQVGQKYGMEMLTGPYTGLLARATLALDKNNVIKYTEMKEEVNDAPNYNQILFYARSTLK